MVVFEVGDKIKFVDSDFFKKHSKNDSEIKSFMRDGLVFEVIYVTSSSISTQFVTAVNRERGIQLSLYNANFFKKV